MECLTVSSIRHVIGVQWTVKVKDILQDFTSQESDTPLEVPKKTIGSIQCRIKGMDGLIFSLELTSQLNVLVKSRSRGSCKIIYAFAILKDRAFLMNKSENLKFLDQLGFDHLNSVEEATLHFMLLVRPHTQNLTSDESSLTYIDESLPTEGEMCVNLEGIQQSHWEFDGEIPEFTIDKAKKLISDENVNSVLKVLAMEYLFKSLNAENLTDILKIAIDHDLKVLQKQCSDFLTECTILNAQNDNISLSSSTSTDSEHMRRLRSILSSITANDIIFYDSDD